MAHQYVRALDAPNDEAMRRYVALAGAPREVIGHAALWPFWSDGYRMNLVVARDWRRLGVGSRLLARMVDDARADGAITLQGRAGESIVITTLESEQAHEPLCWRRFRDLHVVAREGWPSPDPRPKPDPQWTIDEFRNRGIATALKVRAVEAARARGVPTIRTASGDPAMLRVNERLGFRRTSTEIRLVKPLT